MLRFGNDARCVSAVARELDLSIALLERYIRAKLHPEWLHFPGTNRLEFDTVAMENVLMDTGVDWEPFNGFPGGAA